MALTGKSLFLYGFQVTENNRSIDFLNVSMGSEIQATLTLGFYSLDTLLDEISRAMNAADVLNTYTVTANRTINGGTENRVTISTTGSFLSILWNSGSRSASSARTLIGFANSDSTGATTYTGSSSSGTSLAPELVGYSYIGEEINRRVNGAVNISANGEKETIVFQVQKFIQVGFKYEPEAKVLTEWSNFMTWAIQQRLFEFTPDINSPNTFSVVTLEKTPSDGRALAFIMREMIPNFPFLYETGTLTMRVKEIV